MNALIPVHASQHVLNGVSEYLATSFSLANPETSAALKAFLESEDGGMFYGPYVRTRLPYARAADCSGLLEWLPAEFTPYHHQAEAFRRLRSKSDGVGSSESTSSAAFAESGFTGVRRPSPTLVITGTGSGKTESFLYPVLDHAMRMRSLGQEGVKALLLYPMNALANDQADRLARLISSESELAGVTAGILTGDQRGDVTAVAEQSLITSREHMMASPPDILLTNYKMLDQLLLQPKYREIWKKSATSLQYLVLDEFHTYDGAQGTDVALLLRRLGLQLKAQQPEGFLGEYSSLPLGRVTPVATSATLGGDDALADVCAFAETIFGEPFSPDAVVGERTLTYDSWAEEISARFGRREPGPMPDLDQIRAINAAIASDDSGRDHADVVLEVFRTTLWEASADLESVIAAYAVHPLTEQLLKAAATARPLVRRPGEDTVALPPEVLGEIVVRSIGVDDATEFVTHLLTAVAHVRALAGEEYGFGGKRLPGVETHLWVREVSRIDRAVTPTETGEVFRWSDDGRITWDDSSAVWLPACYCRTCGRAGWMTALEAGTDAMVLESGDIRRLSIEHRERTRPLIDATNELRKATESGLDLTEFSDEGGRRALMWFHTETKQLNRTAPSEREGAEGLSVPVLTYTGLTAEEHAQEQTCPSCGEKDSIRFIGSRVATLLSVGLSNLFGMPELSAEEKKTLVFTDSVQDAAHRAGFVQSRSRAFGIRSLMHAAVAGKATVEQLPLRVVEAADASAEPARARYEILPREIVETSSFRPFWDEAVPARDRREATAKALNRLALDSALEFGARAHLPRSLVYTGAVNAYVDAADSELLGAARTAISGVTSSMFDPQLDDATLLGWVRGLLELMRTRGGIYSPLLRDFIVADGNTWKLNNRYAKALGVPGFPKGGAPEFPRSGPVLDDKDRGITPLGSPRGRYAVWSANVLSISTHDAATALTALFRELALGGVVKTISTVSGGTTYALDPSRVVVEQDSHPEMLQCVVCHTPLGASAPVRVLLQGCPCPTPGCVGHLEEETIEENYYSRMYTSSHPRTVVAKEHTGLVPKDERLALEKAFRGVDGTLPPDAPNVLVATPTLEMGIDIGDLSTVMLASLPTSVASYVQRVGRAGRLTGNSLVLAFVQGRGVTLPKLNQPLSVIAGTVTPPAAFLSATEILRRQVTAYLIDTLDIPSFGLQLKDAVSVFSTRKLSLVQVLQDYVAGSAFSSDEVLRDDSSVALRVDEFLDAVGTDVVDETTLSEVRQWVLTVGGPDSDTLTGELCRRQQQWDGEVKTLRARLDVLQARNAELAAKVDPNAGTDKADPELEREKRTTKAAFKRISRDLSEIFQGEHWVSSLERYGLLPNFTLLDDSVELAVVVSQLNPSTLQFDPETFELSRGVSSALTELAPGSTFYARGIAATVDAVELGADGADLEQWRLCPACSYGEKVNPGSAITACPQCGEKGFADKGQVVDSVRMRRVSAEVDRSRASIETWQEERRNAWFQTTVCFDAPPHGRGGRWFLSGGFGAEFLRHVSVSWFNLGQGQATKRIFANHELDAPLFTVCNHCGHLDSEKGSNSKWDHRPWCPQRSAIEEDTVTIALSRTLHTQGVLLHVPVQLTAADHSTIPSLTAALKLGFKEVLGGDPVHLNVVTIKVPAGSDAGGSGAGGSGADDNGAVGTPVDALLLHDSVPGGTGYLSQFASPEQVRMLLEKAFSVVSECACADDDRLACPKCLLPYANPRQLETTSRAAAERALRAILRNEDYPSPDADPFEVAWETQEVAPQLDSASSLEIRFRQTIRAALEARKATVKDIPSARGIEWSITFPDGEQWKMEEQVDRGYTRPDFVFSHRTKPNVRPVAVYTDGAAFHISETHYRFPEDITLRNRLRLDTGWLPWTITAADLDWFEQEKSQMATPPQWSTAKGVQIASSIEEIDSTAIQFLQSSPVSQLLHYLENFDLKSYSALDQALVAMVNVNSTRERLGSGMRITFRNELQIDVVPSGARMLPTRLAVDAPTAGSLSKDGWVDFLRFADILWLADGLAVLSTGGEEKQQAAVLEEPSVVSDSDAAGADDWSPLWREAIEEFSDEDDSVLASALRLLADAGAIETEEIGEEVGSLPTAVMWRELKIALLIDSDESYASAESDLRSQGWTLLHPDTLSSQDIPPALLSGQ